MLNEVFILTHYNLYESKRYFSARLADAFQRKGIRAKVFESQEGEWLRQLQNIQKKKPDLICTFHRTLPMPTGEFWWDIEKQPFLTMLVDPAVQYTELIFNKYSAISCVDHFDCEFFRECHFESVFFLGHAVEPELTADPAQDRNFDLVFIGSSYDPESMRHYWQKTMPKAVSNVLDAACEITLSDLKTPHWRALRQAASELKHELTKSNFQALCTYVDVYTRGMDRLQLIKSIKNAAIHLFGGTCQSAVCPVLGWAQLLSHQDNVTVHPTIPFHESLEILKRSKICLNSMPFFKNGTHERIFTGLACGALPISSDNLWLKDNFVDGEDIVTYQPKQWDAVNDRVDYFLTHEAERAAIVEKGRAKVMKYHTWDNRVDELIAGLDSLKDWPPGKGH